MVKIPPDLWFVVFCREVHVDAQGRLDLRGIFYQVSMVQPPEASGIPPHAPLDCVLAVGFTRGVGDFLLELRLLDESGKVVWGPVVSGFEIGKPHLGHVQLEQMQAWLTQPGRYVLEVSLDGEFGGATALTVAEPT